MLQWEVVEKYEGKLPYQWYIWRTLSLAIRQQTQIGKHLVWRIGQGLPKDTSTVPSKNSIGGDFSFVI